MQKPIHLELSTICLEGVENDCILMFSATQILLCIHIYYMCGLTVKIVLGIFIVEAIEKKHTQHERASLCDTFLFLLLT